jgi:dihydroorotase
MDVSKMYNLDDNDPNINILLDEIELQYDDYDFLMFSMIEEPTFGADYIFDIQMDFASVVMEKLNHKFPNAKIIAGGNMFEQQFIEFKKREKPPYIDYIHPKHITKESMKKIIDGEYENIDIVHTSVFPPAQPNIPTKC